MEIVKKIPLAIRSSSAMMPVMPSKYSSALSARSLTLTPKNFISMGLSEAAAGKDAKRKIVIEEKMYFIPLEDILVMIILV
ncbi:MAG: hypothetical protein WCQ96_05345 [Patescibacteria group bacterium]